MDSMSLNDLVFECIRAFVLVALLGILFLRGSFTSLARHRGWRMIVAGFCLITLATLLDITDEIPGLERYVIIGDTIYEAFIEKLPGYLLGFILVLVGFYRMIPSLQRADQIEQALHESEERFRQIFLANPDPVILARLADGAITDANPAFEQQTGISRAEALGKNSADLGLWVNAGQRDIFREKLTKAGAIDNMESVFSLRDGSVRPGLLSARIVTISGDPFILVVIRDISVVKEAETALLETDRIRNEFVSTAAHELRTPLSVLIGYAELLSTPEGRDRFSDEKRQEFIAEISRKGQVLSQIVDDLLDISRMSAGLKFELKKEPVNPDELLRKGFEQYQVQVCGHRFCLDLTRPETEIVCDEQRILQVLDNLLSNAIKYTAEGGRITLASGESEDCYEFSVSDEGIGMTLEQVGRVFEKFYRVDSSNTAVGGLGLGMSIVKQIVDAHGGSVLIDSTPGEGTTVTIRLPKPVVQ